MRAHEQYFVYKYTFENGYFYIGRTFDGSKRFGNDDRYRGQFVKKYMDDANGEYVKDVLYISDNPIACAYMESKLIKENWSNLKCLNVSNEDN